MKKDLVVGREGVVRSIGERKSWIGWDKESWDKDKNVKKKYMREVNISLWQGFLASVLLVWVDDSLLWGPVLPTGRFRALLASTHEIREQPEPPVVTNKNVSRQ